MQKKEEARQRSKAKEWDGQWSAPHGDDNFYDVSDEGWEIDGLGITGTAKSKPSFTSSEAFVSAKTLKSRLESLEVGTEAVQCSDQCPY